MHRRLLDMVSFKTTLIAIVSALMIACASERPVTSDQPIEPSFHEKVVACSKIADRGERDRCLYGE